MCLSWYPFGKKGWKVYDLETHEHFVSRDVKFFESEFPYSLSEIVTTTPPSVTCEAERGVE